jgi:hypothetical protein
MSFDFDMKPFFSFGQRGYYGLQAINFAGMKLSVGLRNYVLGKNERLVNLHGLKDFPAKAHSKCLVGIPYVSWDRVLWPKFVSKLYWCKSYTMGFAQGNTIVINIKLSMAHKAIGLQSNSD